MSRQSPFLIFLSNLQSGCTGAIDVLPRQKQGWNPLLPAEVRPFHLEDIRKRFLRETLSEPLISVQRENKNRGLLSPKFSRQLFFLLCTTCTNFKIKFCAVFSLFFVDKRYHTAYNMKYGTILYNRSANFRKEAEQWLSFLSALPCWMRWYSL